MARLRTLKPSFFTNEELAEIPMAGRLLFQGLWCIADREGRLEDRPRRIKAEVLPYDDADVDALLAVLHDAGFIQRYEVDGGRYIQVVSFTKHQTPHVKEAASTIPAPGEHRASTGLVPGKPDESTIPAPLLLGSRSSSGNLELGSGGLPGATTPEAPPKASRASRMTVVPLTDDGRAKLLCDFPDVRDAAEQIELALSHKNARNYSDQYRYVRNWLSNQRKWDAERNGSRNGTGYGGKGPPKDDPYSGENAMAVARENMERRLAEIRDRKEAPA